MVDRLPKEEASGIGKVEKSSYFAHSIRKIEQMIREKLNKHYRIITHVSKSATKASIRYFDQCCEIHLPAECEEMDDEKIRLTLAHELGHLVYSIERLKNPEILDNMLTTNDEEQYAWEFAFYLVKTKSDEHRSSIRQNKFVYDDYDLKKMLSAIVKEKAKPEVYDSIVKSLGLVKFNT